MIEVWQALDMRDAQFEPSMRAAFPVGYIHVANVDTNDLEVAFELTNTIDRAWWSNPGVQAKVSPCRSTSVGDIMVKDTGSRHWVAGMGFEVLPEE